MAEDETAITPPHGFVRSERRGPFTEHNGPLFHKADTDSTVHGFQALKRHCNGYGIVHGGMLASFLDGLLGHAVGAAAKRPAVTIHLSLDYLSMARAGDWIEGEAKVTRLTRDVAFAEARAYAGSTDLIRATALFKLMGRKTV